MKKCLFALLSLSLLVLATAPASAQYHSGGHNGHQFGHYGSYFNNAAFISPQSYVSPICAPVYAQPVYAQPVVVAPVVYQPAPVVAPVAIQTCVAPVAAPVVAPATACYTAQETAAVALPVLSVPTVSYLQTLNYQQQVSYLSQNYNPGVAQRLISHYCGPHHHRR